MWCTCPPSKSWCQCECQTITVPFQWVKHPPQKVAFHLNLSDPPCHHHGMTVGRLGVPWLGTPNAAWFQTLWALMQPWQHAIRASNGHLWWFTMLVEMWTNRKRAPWNEASWSIGGGFKYFLCSPRKLGFHDPIWRANCSSGWGWTTN